ncbi:hypothetical protein BKA63DRAFT_525206 [Paraphoma chrysanthemicola]|nr:hypothetical protein BKA63DRAFT_525206 [Paraphoma chrysanthemicola]
MSTMNPPPVSVACLRCRKQKLRCTREQPECRRCVRTNHACSYPPPPDRKGLAARRNRGRFDSADRHRTTSSDNRLNINQPSQVADPCTNTNGDEHISRNLYDSSAGTPQETAFSSLYATHVNSTRPSVPDCIEDAHVAEEVALFLIEIYFERHYQADLLFHKQSLIDDYLSQRLPGCISLAVFAFASVFLTHVPGGNTSGNLEISDISSVDWYVVGERWAERAGQIALMKADKPCLEVVQTCQILAMFWLARSKTERTNMHAMIAYRSCRILQFHRQGSEWARQHPLEAIIRARCLWACWLTQCASHINARFRSDCWAEVLDCPLPESTQPYPRKLGERYVDNAGSVYERGIVGRTSRLDFHACLVIIHGLWWEVQHLVFTMQENRQPLYDPTPKIYALDERLHDLHASMDDLVRYFSSTVKTSTNSTTLSRIFSLNFTYHLCLCYMYSALVPILSCGIQVPTLPKRLLRLAAEQAWKHSSIMVDMTEHFLSRKGVISKLWPIVGYGAYVCAAIQLRCLLALGSLTMARLKRCESLLRLIGELKNYWGNVSSLHTQADEQFAKAREFLNADEDLANEAQISPDDLAHAIVSPATSMSTHWRTSISTYIADEEHNQPLVHEQQNESRQLRSGDMPEATEREPSANIEETVPLPLQSKSPAEAPHATQSWPIQQSTPTSEILHDHIFPQTQQSALNDVAWWEQVPDAFADLFGQDFHAANYGFVMDT